VLVVSGVQLQSYGGKYHAMPTPAEIAREKLLLAEACDLSNVRARFCKLYDVTADEALACERELTRYFILGVAFPDSDHGMYGRFVDEFWHTFLVFTMDYVDFCRDVFGRYVHHVPISDEDRGSSDVAAPWGRAPESTFADFAMDYEQAFEEPLPEIWRRPAPAPRA
jgi:hypothetical protein